MWRWLVGEDAYQLGGWIPGGAGWRRYGMMLWPAAGVGSYEVENIMSSGQGKFPLEVVTDNSLLRQRYEDAELEGKLPLYVTTTSAQGVVFGVPELVAHRKFPGFVPCIVASLVSGSTYGQAGTLVTVSATGHGMTAALNGRAIYWPGSAVIPAGFYRDFQYVDANTFTFSNPTTQTVASGSALTPALPFTSSVKIASRTIPGGTISSTGKIVIDFTAVADNSAALKSLHVKLAGAQCGLSQVGSTPNISGQISICADGSTNKQFSTAGLDGNVSSGAYQTAVDTTTDQALEIYLQMSGPSQFRSIVSVMVREVP